MKVFSGNNAETKAIKMIANKYALFKVLVLVNTEIIGKVQPIINKITEVVKCVKVLDFPKGVVDRCVISSLIRSEFTEDVGLVVNFADENVLEVVNLVCGDIKTMSFLTEPNFCVCLCENNCLVADYNLIGSSSNKAIADCVGKLNALAFYLIENAFNRAVLNVGLEFENVVELESIIEALTTFPSAILKQKLGKVLLTQMCLKLKDLINFSSFKNSCVYKLATIILSSSKYEWLTFGEGLIISNTLLFKMFRVLCGAKTLSSQIGFDYYNCEKRTRKFVKCNGNKFDKFNLFIDEELQLHINNFLIIRLSFLEVLNTYEDVCAINLKHFKNLHNDRGVYLNKYLKERDIVCAVSVLPEQFNVLNFATFIRNAGLLNKFNV